MSSRQESLRLPWAALALTLALFLAVGCRTDLRRPTVMVPVYTAAPVTITARDIRLDQVTPRDAWSESQTQLVETLLAERLVDLGGAIPQGAVARHMRPYVLDAALAGYRLERISRGRSLVEMYVTLELEIADDRGRILGYCHVEDQAYWGDEGGPTSVFEQTHIDNLLRDLVWRGLGQALQPAQKQPSVRVQLQPGLTDYDGQGRQLAADGQYAQALAAFERAVDAEPTDHCAMFNAGVICEILKKTDLAAAYYGRALELIDDPTYRQAYERVSGLNSPNRLP